jgi:hypothetical protein
LTVGKNKRYIKPLVTSGLRFRQGDHHVAFTTALYYPWIDIRDDSWLKTALLYWDTVQTIVPESMTHPYSSALARVLQEKGFLLPLRVNSDMEEIQDLAQAAVAYLETTKGGELQALLTERRGPRRLLEKRRLMYRGLTGLYPEKLAWQIRQMLPQYGAIFGGNGEPLKVDSAFAAYYMTLLATRLSERIGAALLTPLSAAEQLAISARLDSQLAVKPRGTRPWGPRRWIPPALAQGMLAHLAIERISIDPDTPIDRLIEFRQQHSDELARFRTKVEELTADVISDLPLEALRQKILDTYNNEVTPAISDLKQALAARSIRWLGEGLLRITFLSAGSSSMLLAAGLSVPTALLAGAGLSLIVSGAIYNSDRAESLRANPFTYLLTVGSSLR